MYKDYMSLEMASFIIRLRVLAPKNCFITPSLWQTGPAEGRPRWPQLLKEEKYKIFYKDYMKVQRTIDCASMDVSCEVKYVFEIV